MNILETIDRLSAIIDMGAIDNPLLADLVDLHNELKTTVSIDKVDTSQMAFPLYIHGE